MIRVSSRETCIWADADVLGDLLLAAVLEEAQVEDPAVPFFQQAYQGGQGDPGLRRGLGPVLLPDEIAHGGQHAAVEPRDRTVERGGGEAAIGRHRLDDVAELDVQVVRDL